MSSAKNKLQEYFQKKGLSLPKYSTARCGGTSHEPVWVSNITTDCEPFLDTIGPTCISKKEAEIAAAQLALEELGVDSEEHSRDTLVKSIDTKTYFIIDVENQAKIAMWLIECLKDGVPQNASFVFVMSRGCNILAKIVDSVSEIDNKHVYTKITKSLAPDAADVACMMYATLGLIQSDVVIVSNDRFAAVFTEVANEVANETHVNNVVTKKELSQFLLE